MAISNNFQEFTFDLFPDHTLYVQVYTGVTKAKEIAELRDSLGFVSIDGNMISCEMHLLIAANCALQHKKVRKEEEGRESNLICKNLESELIFCMSPSKNKDRTFQAFALKNDSTTVVFVTFSSDAIKKAEEYMINNDPKAIVKPLVDALENDSNTNWEILKRDMKIKNTTNDKELLNSLLISSVACQDSV